MTRTRLAQGQSWPQGPGAVPRRRWLAGVCGWPAAAWLMPGLGVLAGCGEQPEPEAEPAPLRLAMDLWPGYYPALLAEELGYFEAAKLKVQVSFPANTDRMMADFAAGQYDIITIG